ncbi:MAG: DNA polymerase I [Patescibacteria group bacterium]|nr:DNA polymerase I [Patescibacteria group bacterium]MBU1870991.1 DNA polymerase I [Patescibacteria group bacterium]
MTSSKKEKFIIIDGNALIHRSFYALPPLTIKSGEMVNAVYGFTAVLLKALREFKPNYVALTLDRKEKTFRHEQYARYKANRVKAPDELYEQIPKVKEIAQAFNIPIFELAGYEADDLIGTLVHSVEGEIEKIIVTGDLDALQLIDEKTKVFTMKHGLTDSVLYDIEAVKQRYGLLPEQMIDFKALRGDPSDNIPGVKGIGEKTAINLLQKFDTLNKIYEYVDQVESRKSKAKEQEKIKERIFKLLVQYKKDAYMSKKLVTIKHDAPIKFELDKASFGSFNQEQIAKLFNNFEFKSLLPRLYGLTNINSNKQLTQTEETTDKFARNKAKFKYYLIDNDEKFKNFLKQLIKQKEFTFDTETVSCDTINSELLGISFSWKRGEAYYINFQFSIFNFQLKNADLFNYQDKTNENLVNQKWLNKLKPIFEDEKIKKYGHNIKYDIKVMASLNIDVKGIISDSMIASYLLNPGSRKYNLDIVTFNEFNFQKITKNDLLGAGRDKIDFEKVALEKLYLYSCEDADFTNRLIKKLVPELKKQNLNKLFDEIEMPLVLTLAMMEMNGIKINKNFLFNMDKEIDKEIKELQKNIYKSAGMEFNVNSTQQLRQVLFEKLAIPTIGITKNKTGLSTGADELIKLKNQHPIINLIQKYRELIKLSTTYINALPKLVNPKTNRIHTSFNQTVAATGRLSSSEPNLQNIPIKTESGYKIRQAFIADDGCKLLSLDYSQIELRLAAHMSGDKKMIQAFKQSKDIHIATAAEINQIDLDKVTSKLRQEAKAVNFGILYGQGPYGLSHNANIPYAQAKEFIDKYFIVFNGIKKFIEQTIKGAKEKGYTETLFKRRRFLPEINSSIIQIRKAAERMAINAPIQGTAADIIKIAMIKTKEMLDKKYLPSEVKMLLQVHDELVFEVKKELIEKVSKEIKEIMENIIKLKVPLIVEAKIGENWGEMKKI